MPDCHVASWPVTDFGERSARVLAFQTCKSYRLKSRARFAISDGQLPPRRKSGSDAVDGSSFRHVECHGRGELLKLQRFGEATHANDYDNRSGYREVAF